MLMTSLTNPLQAFGLLMFALTWAGVSEGNGKLMNLIPPRSLLRLQQVRNSSFG